MEASFSNPDNGLWSFGLNWGDGNMTSVDVSASGVISGISPRVYNLAGNFRATLSVTDAKNATGTSTGIRIRVR